MSYETSDNIFKLRHKMLILCFIASDQISSYATRQLTSTFSKGFIFLRYQFVRNCVPASSIKKLFSSWSVSFYATDIRKLSGLIIYSHDKEIRCVVFW